MTAKVNISSEEHPVIIECEILYKDNIHGGVNNYIVRRLDTDALISVHRNKITNYDELLKHYGPKKSI